VTVIHTYFEMCDAVKNKKSIDISYYDMVEVMRDVLNAWVVSNSASSHSQY